MMHFGVVGLGSMGKRRVRDLLALGHQVIGFDLRSDRCAQAQQMFDITVVSNFEALANASLDALIISTPPDQHLTYYQQSFTMRLPFFSEANILTPKAEWFYRREKESGVRGYPSATWRFYPLFDILRQQLTEMGRDQINSVHYHYGGYLPLWHPWEDYEKFYAGRSRYTCAAREMVPFELEWFCWIFGPLKAVCCVQDRRADWKTDIDDTYLLLLEFDSGLRGTLIVELHQVAPFRIARVSGRRQSFRLDVAGHELHRYDLESDDWTVFTSPSVHSLEASFDFEQIYMAEIKAFVDTLEGRGTYPKTWVEDRHLSNILYAAEESWRCRAWVTIDEVEAAYDGLSLITE